MRTSFASLRLQRSLVYFSTSIRGNEAMLGRLRTTSRASSVDPDLFEDVSIELRQAYNTINIYTDIVTSMMDASANIISNNVNTIMKRIDEYLHCADGADDDLELLRNECQRLPRRMVLGIPCDLRRVG